MSTGRERGQDCSAVTVFLALRKNACMLLPETSSTLPCHMSTNSAPTFCS